jgi:hypothetical protein
VGACVGAGASRLRWRLRFGKRGDRPVGNLSSLAVAFLYAVRIADRRYVLDGNPIISEKPAKSDDLTSARSEGAQGNNKVARKAGIHQSWADMVKSWPPNQANAGLQPLNKR